MHPYHIITLPEVASTNTYARQALAEGTILPNMAIVAATQTAGRGQMQTTWHDEPEKNLLFTLVVQPKHLKAVQFFRLNEAVSVALIAAIAPWVSAKIKWPNDIMHEGKKLAGILIETSVKGEYVQNACIGVGLNVNQLQFAVDLNATSMALAACRQFSVDEVRDALLNQLHLRLIEIGSSHNATEYQKNLFGLHQTLHFSDANGEFTATVAGVAGDGALRLEVAGEASPRSYRFKEVKWLLP